MAWPLDYTNYLADHEDNVSEEILAEHVNRLERGANAMEAELGLGPSGAAADVAARFDQLTFPDMADVDPTSRGPGDIAVYSPAVDGSPAGYYHHGEPNRPFDIARVQAMDGVSYRRGAFSLIIWDANLADYTATFPALKTRDLTAGFGIISSVMGGTAGKFTWANALEMQGRGMEIFGHTRNHANPTGAGWANYDEEIRGARETMLAQKLYIEHFGQPGSWVGDYTFDSTAKLRTRLGRHLHRHYLASYTANVDDANPANYPATLPKARRTGYSGLSGDSMSDAQLLIYLEAVKRIGGHMILAFHGGSWGGGVPAGVLALLDGIAAARDAGQLDVLTPTGVAFARQRKGLPTNLFADAQMLAQATGAIVFPWQANNAPTILLGQGYRPGSNAARCTSANYVRQDLLANQGAGAEGSGPRWLHLEVMARSATPGTPTNARVYSMCRDAANALMYADYPQKTVNVDGWTKIRLQVANHPDARFIETRFDQPAAQPAEVVFSDPMIYKV